MLNNYFQSLKEQTRGLKTQIKLIVVYLLKSFEMFLITIHTDDKFLTTFIIPTKKHSNSCHNGQNVQGMETSRSEKET